jgi:membrane protease YdiL (CAAX protease family)
MNNYFTRQPLVLFFGLACAISWALWIAAAGLGISIETPTGRALEIAGNFGPLIAALVVAYFTLGLSGLRKLIERLVRWRLSRRWYLVALLGPLAVMALAIGLSTAFGAPPIQSLAPAGLLALIPTFFHTLFLAGGLNEETGWRGYALPEMLAKMSAFRASMLLGVLWGLWHTPLYFLPGTGQNEMIRSGGSIFFLLPAFVLWTAGLSVIFTWLSDRTGGSLLLAILFHAAINTSMALPNALGVQNSLAGLLYPALTWVVAIVVARGKPFAAGTKVRKVSTISR